MKDIRQKIVALLKEGYATPQIARMAKRLHEPSTTIHYNIKRLEKDKVIIRYKGIFTYAKIDQGYCTFLLINLVQEKYADPESVAREIAKSDLVESVNVITGDYELLLKLRCKDVDEYYAFVKGAIKKHGFAKVISLTSIKELKGEFVQKS
jgi:DNA-binding Lrp family transcriptional regulator